MATSRRQRILEALLVRLQAIQRASGFQTDAGLSVFMGAGVVLGPDDPDEVAVLVAAEDEVRIHGDKVAVELPVEMYAIAKAEVEQPWARVEAVIADIKKAIELPDRSLGGLTNQWIRRVSTRPMERNEGSLVVGAVVLYQVPYTEQWGHP